MIGYCYKPIIGLKKLRAIVFLTWWLGPDRNKKTFSQSSFILTPPPAAPPIAKTSFGSIVSLSWSRPESIIHLFILMIWPNVCVSWSRPKYFNVFSRYPFTTSSGWYYTKSHSRTSFRAPTTLFCWSVVMLWKRGRLIARW